MEVRCPHCHAPIDLPSDTSLSDITCPSCGRSFGLLGEDETASFTFAVPPFDAWLKHVAAVLIGRNDGFEGDDVGGVMDAI